jgi:RNase P subunit RPR2
MMNFARALKSQPSTVLRDKVNEALAQFEEYHPAAQRQIVILLWRLKGGHCSKCKKPVGLKNVLITGVNHYETASFICESCL